MSFSSTLPTLPTRPFSEVLPSLPANAGISSPTAPCSIGPPSTASSRLDNAKKAQNDRRRYAYLFGANSSGSKTPPKQATGNNSARIWPGDESAGYFLRCAMDADPIGKDALEKSLPIQETLDASRYLLPVRGNVVPDIEKTGHYSTWLTWIAYELAEMMRPEIDHNAQHASASAYVGAGNCDQGAAISASVHGEKLKPGQSMTRLKVEDPAHTFMRIEGRSDYILDPWGTGPVVRARHSEFGGDPLCYRTEERYDHKSGPALTRQFRYCAEVLRRDPSAYLYTTQRLRLFQEEQAKEIKPFRQYTPILSGEFLARTSQAMKSSHQRTWGEAKTLARSFGHRRENSVAQTAAAIIDAAIDLDP